MEQSVILAEQEQTKKELGLKPTLVKDITLISSGTWTGMDNKPTNFSTETIMKGFQNTDWSNMNLFLDHQDQRSRGVSNWAGFVRNPRMVGNDLVGDLEVWHPMISMFIKEAKAKFGVSMTTEGVERMMANDLFDYDIHRFVSFSIVDDPACKVSLIDKVLSSKKETKTFISNKELACQGPSQKKIISKTQSENIIQKEVKEMESEKDQKEAVEENKEDKKEEAVEDKKELAEANKSEDVKVLSSKVDSLSGDMKELKAMLKSLSEKKELAEKPAKEEKAEEPEESDADKELVATKEKLANAEKELAALKEDDSPDRKSLAIGGNASGTEDVNSVNMGMLGFLRENANLNY